MRCPVGPRWGTAPNNPDPFDRKKMDKRDIFLELVASSWGYIGMELAKMMGLTWVDHIMQDTSSVAMLPGNIMISQWIWWVSNFQTKAKPDVHTLFWEKTKNWTKAPRSNLIEHIMFCGRIIDFLISP